MKRIRTPVSPGLLVALLGLAVPMPGRGLAQSVLPPKAAPSPKSSKTTEDDALKKAIDAVNRGAEKAKKSDAPADTPGNPSQPAAKPAAAKVLPVKPVAGSSARPTKPSTTTQSAAKPEASTPKTTRITSEKDGELLNKEGLVIFRTNVLVDREDLKIWCDELQVTMNQKPHQKVAETPQTKEAPEDSDVFSAQNVKQAMAKSPSTGAVVIWRKTPKGEIVAVGREAIYDGASGNITLKGAPEVLQDLKVHLRSEGEAQQIVLMKNGNVKGSNRFAAVPEAEAREIRKRIFARAPMQRASGSPGVSGASPTPSVDRSPSPTPPPRAGLPPAEPSLPPAFPPPVAVPAVPK